MDFTSGILSVTGINATAHIFASYPARHLSVLGGFIDQVSSARCDPVTSDPPLLPQFRLQIVANAPNAANAALIGPVGVGTPPQSLRFGCNDPFPGIPGKARSILTISHHLLVGALIQT